MRTTVAEMAYTAMTAPFVAGMAPVSLLRKSWRDRFWPQQIVSSQGGGVWWHGASAGEVEGLVSLVGAAGSVAALTSTTEAGLEMWRARLEGHCAIGILQVDWPPLWRRTLAQMMPQSIVVSETELWPGLLMAAAARDVPLAIVSGRLSPHSLRWHSKFLPSASEEMWRRIYTCAKDECQAERFEALGVPFDRIAITGCLKRAAQPPHDRTAARQEFGVVDGCRLVVCGSTRRSEVDVVSAGVKRWMSQCEHSVAIVAPRKGCDVLYTLRRLKQMGFDPLRRTAGETLDTGQVLVLDTMGDLKRAYAAADATVLGGTFCSRRGGHNPYEAAATGRPVIVGPHFGQPDADDLLSDGRIWRVDGDECSIAGAIERASKAATRLLPKHSAGDPVAKTLSSLRKWGLVPQGDNG